ncbi:MAG: isopentenyl-diphosphate Delta-isomerase, partial [Lachnospiraceae bacterium]
KFDENLYEYEYDHIYVGFYDGEVHFDPNEIEEIKWVDLDWLEDDLVNNPQNYTAWFLISAPKVLEFYRE